MVEVKITDKILFEGVIKANKITLKAYTLENVISELINKFGDDIKKFINPEKIFDSYLFILNGVKVINKDEYASLRLNDNDTIIIAPLVEGG